MHTGEVGTEIAPVFEAGSADEHLCLQVDAALRRTCAIARALTGAEQAALKLWVDGDAAKARKYFSLSEKYADYRDFRIDPHGVGLHGMAIPPGEVIRLTQDEVLGHPLWKNFDGLDQQHPPMRGWLATSIGGDDGRVYGLLQLSDKGDGSDFTDVDCGHIRELAALVGELLDALRLASSS
jgi:GAF domain-containing protein